MTDCLLQDELMACEQIVTFISPPSGRVAALLTARGGAAVAAVPRAPWADDDDAAAAGGGGDSGRVSLLPPKSGAMLKRGEQKSSSWKERYFVLLPAKRTLQYYTAGGGAKGAALGDLLATGTDGVVGGVGGEVADSDEHGGDAAAAAAAAASPASPRAAVTPKLVGEVQLRNISRLAAATDEAVLAKQPFAFELVEPGRVWLLAAPSAEAREEWVAAIGACVPPSLLHAATFGKLRDHRGGWKDRYFVLDPVAQSATYYGAEGRACRGEIRFADITIAGTSPALSRPPPPSSPVRAPSRRLSIAVPSDYSPFYSATHHAPPSLLVLLLLLSPPQRCCPR